MDMAVGTFQKDTILGRKLDAGLFDVLVAVIILWSVHIYLPYGDIIDFILIVTYIGAKILS